ncbi:tyrosinase family protein [Methylobacterium nonmethylotrophicum]|uniref:Tyrosinase family protein n=2 Tax=Methylobacterium nonmethylotrophicum TaxID=1141884 RepID=A0A4Z0NTW6_9HYPH|nr:tyrosinase family protein [Methylobacterium nonmethylotrophicum]
MLKLVAPSPGPASVNVTVSAKTLASGGSLLFADHLTHAGSPTIDVTLPGNGQEVAIWVGGAFPTASSRYGDVSLVVRDKASGLTLGTQDLMVRIRKDANTLSVAERDRFLAALATLNGAGTGRYNDFRDMHVGGPPDTEAHGGPGFLPWHRSYLLDFERELQAIDPEVTLPYWRFDRAAPNVFTRAFMGVANALNQVQFAAGNPLTGWVASGLPGIDRGRGIGPSTVPSVLGEKQTLALGGTATPSFGSFRTMQGNPHGRAHMSHVAGWITNPTTAPRDPIFFLLHCNVDRLWAKWQWATKIHDPAKPASFAAGTFPPGHNLPDALWPWCGPLAPPRPTTAPGGGLAQSPMTDAPPASPKVREMIDYLGTRTPAHHAFAYDDVPFQI